MSRKFLFLLLTVLACSFFVVGCGGDDGSDGADADPTVLQDLQNQIDVLSDAISAGDVSTAVTSAKAALSDTAGTALDEVVAAVGTETTVQAALTEVAVSDSADVAAAITAADADARSVKTLTAKFAAIKAANATVWASFKALFADITAEGFAAVQTAIVSMNKVGYTNVATAIEEGPEYTSEIFSESCSACHSSDGTYAPTHGATAYSLRGHAYDENGDPEEGFTREVIDFDNAWSAAITDVEVVDAATGEVSITFSVTTTDDTTFVPADDFYRMYVSPYNSTTDIFDRVQPDAAADPVDNGDGTYTVTTVADADVAAGIAADAPFLVYVGGLDDDDTNMAADYQRGNLVNGFGVASIYLPDTDTVSDFDSTDNPRNYVSNESCSQCHGVDEFNFHHNNSARASMESCAACHTEDNDAAHISKIVSRVHGIHNSAGYLQDGEEDYGYGESLTTIGYPNNMSDCAVCHQTDEQLANATSNDKFVIETCISCHGSWGEVYDNMSSTGKVFHANFDETDDCTACHADGEVGDGATLATIHNGTSYMEHKIAAESIEYVIVSATAAGPGEEASVTWKAVDPADDSAYDILNAEKNGEPNFLSDLEFELDHGPSFDVAFFTADDVTNQGATTRDGQPTVGDSFTTENTVAGENGTVVTTFTIPSTVAAGSKVYFNIQGQPNLFDDADDDTALGATVASAVYAFSVTDGAAADARRVTTDMDKCLKCHGTLSLHGGNRIDSIETCVVCHNPNATDLTGRNNYADTDVDVTLGGKDQESYNFAYMIHGIHSATAADEAYYVYRSRGIYGFRGDTALPETFGASEDARWNDVHVEYPRSIASCDACHTDDFEGFADQTMALAVTIDQGSDLSTDADDTVIGPNAAACTSCHRGDISSTSGIKAHARTNGYQTDEKPKAIIAEEAE